MTSIFTGNTSICRYWKILENTGYTSIVDIGRLGRIPVNPSFYVYIILKELNINHPVSAILVLPVFPRIFRYLQYSYFGNDQYLLVLQILENSGRYWDTSIYQYLYQYCRYWKTLENTGNTSIADTGKLWKILVIPVLQILEDSGKYWLYL
jgi:hypothetical protein